MTLLGVVGTTCASGAGTITGSHTGGDTAWRRQGDLNQWRRRMLAEMRAH